VLGGGALALGAIDGVAEAVAAVLKLQAGRWSDRWGKRRPFVVWGYGLSSLTRPLMGLVGSVGGAIAVRSADRIGKGLRTSSRDAMLAAAVPPSQQGRAFGFHRAMDHLGAVMGPVAALGLLAYFGREPENLRKVFLWGALPGLVAWLILWAFVHEPEIGKAPRRKPVAFAWLPPKRLRPFMLALTLFTLGASSDLFLLLKASPEAPQKALGVLPWLWIGLHLVKSGSSLAGGHVTDRIGARRTLTLGWAWYAAIYTVLAFTEPGPWAIALVLLYGLYYGLTEGPEKTLVASLSNERERAEAFGWYHMVTGLGMLPASLLFGWLYDAAGSRTAFLSSAGLALSGLLLFLWQGAPAPARRR
jgi:MFS family permease